MKILITGGNGYIAKSITKTLWNKYYILSPGKDELDLTNSKSVDAFFKDKYFDVVIHTAIQGAATPRDPDETISFWNLVMFYNLVSKREHFNKLINIGSGAEKYLTETPYGYSKNIISKLAQRYDNFHTLRIYGVFSEDELNTRFIKASINNILQGNPIKINQDKLMDFIYMPDLIATIEFFMTNSNLPKEVDCVYKNKVTLNNIAQQINEVSINKVPINIEDPLLGQEYIGTYTELPVAYIGLEQGITNVYNKLANAAN